jgi:MOSC domain-containing protein YiiM
MAALQSVAAIAGTGLVGDRYAEARNRRGPKYQLTLIELENIEAFREATGLSLAVDGPRRNIVTTGVRLNELCGLRFRVGAVLVEGLELCEPCTLFRKRTFPEALRFFVGKGGLRARVLEGGVLAVGDQVAVET